LNTQYLRKALAEVANMQEDVKCVRDSKCVIDIKCVKDVKCVNDVRSVTDVIIDDFEDDDDESVTQVTTKRHSLKLIPE
jgi:hypothetical protein